MCVGKLIYQSTIFINNLALIFFSSHTQPLPQRRATTSKQTHSQRLARPLAPSFLLPSAASSSCFLNWLWTAELLPYCLKDVGMRGVTWPTTRSSLINNWLIFNARRLVGQSEEPLPSTWRKNKKQASERQNKLKQVNNDGGGGGDDDHDDGDVRSIDWFLLEMSQWSRCHKWLYQ